MSLKHQPEQFTQHQDLQQKRKLLFGRIISAKKKKKKPRYFFLFLLEDKSFDLMGFWYRLRIYTGVQQPKNPDIKANTLKRDMIRTEETEENKGKQELKEAAEPKLKEKRKRTERKRKWKWKWKRWLRILIR